MSRLGRRITLPLMLALFVFIVLLGTMICVGVSAVILYHLGLLEWVEQGRPNFIGPLFGLLFFCVVLGTAIAAIFSQTALKPIRRVVEATRQVAAGDFNVRVEAKGIRELVELSQSFNTMTDELRSIEMLRSDFVNTISHEFRTPIVSIRGFARLLKDEHLSKAERQEYLDIIITESERLVKLSSSILNLSKAEATLILADKQIFRLDEQLRRLVVMLEPAWAAKQITINLVADEASYETNADLCGQIWLNLIDNAIKFTDPGGIVDICLTNSDGRISVTIQDDGIGMTEEIQGHIFERFYQGDPSRSSSGNGLGLPTVKRIVELCGGTIEVSSEPGSGSLFRVELAQ